MTTSVKRGPLLFGNIQQSGHEEISGAAPLAVNVIVDGTGAVHRRPGIVPRAHHPAIVSPVAPIVALHSTATGRVFAVDAPAPFSHVYELAGANVYDLSMSSETQVTGGRRPIIAETEAMLVITAGGAPVKVLLSTPAVASPLGGGPPQGSHVIAHDARLLINDVRTANTNMIRYSAIANGSSIAGHEDWSSDHAGFFNAQARPDPVVALHENTNEVFAFGTTNLQIFVATTDPTNQWAVAGSREFGCQAAYSVVKYDQNFVFLDRYRRIVLTDGRDFQIISEDIQQTLDDIDDLSDMVGYRVALGPVDALCFYAPRDGRTFVYQTSTKGWSLWQSWNDRTSNFAPWSVRCALRVPETGQMLVGCANASSAVFDSSGLIVSGDVFALDSHVGTDATSGEKIVAHVETGFIDRGTSARKQCRALRLTWRGIAPVLSGDTGPAPSFEPEAFVQWRDDGGPWDNARQVEFGQSSETILRSLGVYRRRQWRVTFSSSNELVLARAEEEYEPLAV